MRIQEGGVFLYNKYNLNLISSQSLIIMKGGLLFAHNAASI